MQMILALFLEIFTMFGKNIQKIRKVKGLSQQAFAELFDLKRAALGAYEEGRSNPKLETVQKIAEYFKLSIDELVSTELTVNRLSHFNDSLTLQPANSFRNNFTAIPCITEQHQAAFIVSQQKAQAIETLPTIHLPLNEYDNYIAYSVTGLEMSYGDRGFFPKDIIVGTPVDIETLHHFEHGELVLIATNSQLLFRRAFAKVDTLDLKCFHDNVDNINLKDESIVLAWKILHVFHYHIPAAKVFVEDKLAMLEKEIMAIKKEAGH